MTRSSWFRISAVLFEHQGLGGTRKYIASPKKKQMPKLLVKHGGEYSPSCSNYMYSRTGKAIGVTIPQSYIMRIAERDKHLFDSPCAVGIEFIDGLQPVDLESIQGNKKLESDMINCFVLAGLFTRFEDLMQTAYLPSVAVCTPRYFHAERLFIRVCGIQSC